MRGPPFRVLLVGPFAGMQSADPCFSQNQLGAVGPEPFLALLFSPSHLFGRMPCLIRHVLRPSRQLGSVSVQNRDEFIIFDMTDDGIINSDSFYYKALYEALARGMEA